MDCCSFCKKKDEEILILIEGITANICDNCVTAAMITVDDFDRAALSELSNSKSLKRKMN